MKSILRSASVAFILFNATVFGAGDAGEVDKNEGSKAVTRVPVVFSAGHETEAVDHGRPVVLIAGGLGVAPEVFRAAFSHVEPADPAKGPNDAEARRNKAALLSALGKHGVTHERLDIVSDFYRYPPGRGSVWKSKPASANALVKNGAVIGFEITGGGAGYSSVPVVAVPGFDGVSAKVDIAFGENLDTNGAVTAITLAGGKPN